ncbi:MAG: hypothetical protein ACE5I8_10185 [Thermodesulfobacteriota bacterium]
MIQKHPICPQRIRKVPSQFSWVDHRLVRDRYLESCTHAAAALYLFLVTVADSQGLSYYSDPSIRTRLSMDALTLEGARRNLIEAGLIAYQKPFYQVLSLDPPAERPAPARAPLDGPVSIGQILKHKIGGAS